MTIDTTASRNGISYPKTFSEMSARRRDMALRDLRPKSNSELTIEKKLNEPITLNFKDTSLDEVDQLHHALHRPERVARLQGAHRRRPEPRRQGQPRGPNGVKLKTALKLMLRPLNLTYKAEDDVLLITSQQTFRDKTVMWHYPVADLVVSPNKANPAYNSSP